MRWYPLRLTAAVRQHVFGGRAIPERIGKLGMPDGRIAETWEVSDEEGSHATVTDGTLAGQTLRELTRRYPDELVGEGWRGERFPLVTRFVDGRTMLPIQLHHRAGPAKAWHALDVGHGASAYAGAKREATKEGLREALLRGDYDSVLRRHPVRPAETMYLPGGTLHSFGPGTLTYEVSEPSAVSRHVMPWRVEDGASLSREEQGNNIEDVLAMIDLEQRPRLSPGLHLAEGENADRIFCCAGPSFVLERVRVLAGATMRFAMHGALVVTNVAPPMRLRSGSHEELLTRGGTVLLPAALGSADLQGPADVLLAYVPDLDRDVRAPLRRAGFAPEVIATLGQA